MLDAISVNFVAIFFHSSSFFFRDNDVKSENQKSKRKKFLWKSNECHMETETEKIPLGFIVSFLVSFVFFDWWFLNLQFHLSPSSSLWWAKIIYHRKYNNGKQQADKQANNKQNINHFKTQNKQKNEKKASFGKKDNPKKQQWKKQKFSSGLFSRQRFSQQRKQKTCKSSTRIKWIWNIINVFCFVVSLFCFVFSLV